MHNTKLMHLGWIVAAGLAGILVAGGFQGDTNKFAAVDIAKVIENSNYGKASQKTFEDMKTARQSVLEFLDANQIASAEQIKQLTELSTKEKPTAADKTALDQLKKDIIAAKDKNYQLLQKVNLTDEERNLMKVYSDRASATNAMMQKMYNDFTKEMQTWADNQKQASVARARGCIAEAAKAQAYTVVYEVGVVPYCANDLTEAALKAMNAKP
jgi:Skp family chaperone for outer membrane proteins